MLVIVLFYRSPLVVFKVYAICRLPRLAPLPQPNPYNGALTIVQSALSAPLLGKAALRKIAKTSGGSEGVVARTSLVHPTQQRMVLHAILNNHNTEMEILQWVKASLLVRS